jgi:hypothetical protein
MSDSVDVLLKIKKEDIYLICPFLESFEGLAAIRNPKPEIGPTATLKLMVSPNFIDEYNKLINFLSRRFEIERLA